MAGKLTAAAALKIAELEGFAPRVARLHSLIESYAAARTNLDTWQSSIKRAGDQLKLGFMTVGLDQLSQVSGSIVMAVSRSGNQNTKTRTMRELMGSLKFQLDFAIRTIIREDETTRRKSVGDE